MIPRRAWLTLGAAMHGGLAALARLVKQKQTLDEVVAAKPTAPWDEVWGKGFMKPDVFTKVVHTDLSKKQP